MSMVKLRIVSASPVVCAPWHLRGALSVCVTDGSHPIGANCRRCSRDIAQPRSLTKRVPICLYCAMDEGVVDCVEVCPDDR